MPLLSPLYFCLYSCLYSYLPLLLLCINSILLLPCRMGKTIVHEFPISFSIIHALLSGPHIIIHAFLSGPHIIIHAFLSGPHIIIHAFLSGPHIIIHAFLSGLQIISHARSHRQEQFSSALVNSTYEHFFNKSCLTNHV